MSKPIESLEDIQRYLKQGFDDWKALGEVDVEVSGNLRLFNYTRKAKEWNWFERASRGLIINSSTGEIVARPFDKFFNWNEDGRRGSGHIVSITEKVDGSMGTLFRDNSECFPYRIATRGSFTGPQAVWATEYFHEHWGGIKIPQEWTMIFEIIYPGNKIVVDYGDREDLVLLAIRNRFTGVYLPYFPAMHEMHDLYGFSLPAYYSFNSIGDIIKATGSLPETQEGWVVEMSDGTRWKFKGDRYRELHKMITGFNFNTVLTAMRNGTNNTLYRDIPNSLNDAYWEYKNKIMLRVQNLGNDVLEIYDRAPKSSRKEFALWVTRNYNMYAPYLFGLWDGKDLRQMILEKGF